MILSVIVNIKNLEKLIEKCLDSLVFSLRNCDENKYEVILVDDNSTDGTEDILKEYDKNHHSFVYKKVYFNNLGKARKNIIPLCKGKYITFIDGDDFLPSFDMQNIISILEKENPDLFITKMHEVFNDIQVITTQDEIKYKIVSKDNTIESFLLHKNFQAHLWGKFFSTNLMKSIEFPDVFCYEDAFFFPSYLNISNKILYSDNIIYNYVKHPTSLSNDLNVEKIELMANVVLSMLDTLPKKYINLNISHSIIHLYKYRKTLSHKTISKLTKEINEVKFFSFILDPKVGFSIKKKYLIIKLK